MRKADFERLREEIKRTRTPKLQAAIAILDDIAYQRKLTRAMYFWKSGIRASDRRWHESIRNISLNLQLGSFKVEYERDYRETCKHVYPDDNLWINGKIATVRDTNKMIDVCDDILAKRKVTSKTSENNQ